MYHLGFGWVFFPPSMILSLLPLSLLPAPVCAVRTVLVEWQPRFLWSERSPDGTEKPLVC